MKILITGAAGFIGYHLCQHLLVKAKTLEVVGLDSINDYYDVNLKYDRLAELGVEKKYAEHFEEICSSSVYGGRFRFIRLQLENREVLPQLFQKEKFDVVCNLAAQAGVRYSIEKPEAYVDSNIVGFLNLLECCRHNGTKHLVYASSSSVYGLNDKVPFSVKDNVDHPISLYAASKKSNELMAHTYSYLFNLPTTGLRFFTVYGPWSRPDMAMFLFTDAIIKDRPIKVFNNGDMERDFTYVDDIVEGVTRVIQKPLEDRALYKVYNIGNTKAVKLNHFITEIERALDKKAKKKFLPMQPGDVYRTWANVDDLVQDYEYCPYTPIQKGVGNFVAWYKKYYKV